MKEKILIIGSSGHAKSCLEIISQDEKYEVAGFIEKNSLKNKKKLKILGTDKDLPSLNRKIKYAFIGIGSLQLLKTRNKIFNNLKKLKYKFPKFISSNAQVSNKAEIKDGSIIMSQVMININVKIGKNCIINNKALIEHDVIIGNNTHISTGAIINGNVNIVTMFLSEVVQLL